MPICTDLAVGRPCTDFFCVPLENASETLARLARCAQRSHVERRRVVLVAAEEIVAVRVLGVQDLRCLIEDALHLPPSGRWRRRCRRHLVIAWCSCWRDLASCVSCGVLQVDLVERGRACWI